MATFISRSVDETIIWARDFSKSLKPNEIIALVGDLGAGKTQLVKGLVMGLDNSQPVTSPTFTILHEYRAGRLPVFHFDFYRLRSGLEIEQIGFSDYLDQEGVTVVEWADRFPQLFPSRTRWLRVGSLSESEREITEIK
jgi:tRNA threonylcarbamoyladenosine biosynthesis protein TsaE